MYILSLSFRSVALLLNVEKSTVHYWVDKFKNVLESERNEGVKKACDSKSIHRLNNSEIQWHKILPSRSFRSTRNALIILFQGSLEDM